MDVLNVICFINIKYRSTELLELFFLTRRHTYVFFRHIISKRFPFKSKSNQSFSEKLFFPKKIWQNQKFGTLWSRTYPDTDASHRVLVEAPRLYLFVFLSISPQFFMIRQISVMKEFFEYLTFSSRYKFLYSFYFTFVSLYLFLFLSTFRLFCQSQWPFIFFDTTNTSSCKHILLLI